MPFADGKYVTFRWQIHHVLMVNVPLFITERLPVIAGRLPVLTTRFVNFATRLQVKITRVGIFIKSGGTMLGAASVVA